MRYETGARVELGSTDDPYTGLRPGARGRITEVTTRGELKVWVAWDDGSRLALLPLAGDTFRIIPDESHDWMSDGDRILCADCEAGKLSSAGARRCDFADSNRFSR